MIEYKVAGKLVEAVGIRFARKGRIVSKAIVLHVKGRRDALLLFEGRLPTGERFSMTARFRSFDAAYRAVFWMFFPYGDDSRPVELNLEPGACLVERPLTAADLRWIARALGGAKP